MYFDTKDYTGPIQRIILLGIDIVVLVVLALGAGLGLVVSRPALAAESPGSVLLPMLLAGYVYLTFAQQSRVGTLGYLLTGVRIVNIEGRRPSPRQMTARLIPLLPVSWSLPFDLGWMLDDPTRQTLRDKWAGTFVIRRKARPLGRTTVTYKRICFGGLQLIIPEIGRHDLGNEPPTPPALDSISSP